MPNCFKKSLIFAVGGLGLAAANPAIAANWSEQDLLDGQCVAYFAADLGASQPDADNEGVMALLGYFVGKIEGRNPGFDLVELLSPEFVANAQQSWDAVGKRCADEGARLGDSLTAAGQVLMSREGS